MINSPKVRFEGGSHVRAGFPIRGRGSQMLASIHPLKFQQAVPLFGGHG